MHHIRANTSINNPDALETQKLRFMFFLNPRSNPYFVMSSGDGPQAHLEGAKRFCYLSHHHLSQKCSGDKERWIFAVAKTAK